MRLMIITYLVIFLLSGCAAVKQQSAGNETEGKEDVYVFDDVTNIDTVAVENIPVQDSTEAVYGKNLSAPDETDPVKTAKNLNPPESKFSVQLGAFSSLENANNFVNDIQSQFDFPLEIFFNEKVNLYTVRTKTFDTREEAEQLRDKLRKTKKFSDAFIVTE